MAGKPEHAKDKDTAATAPTASSAQSRGESPGPSPRQSPPPPASLPSAPPSHRSPSVHIVMPGERPQHHEQADQQQGRGQQPARSQQPQPQNQQPRRASAHMHWRHPHRRESRQLSIPAPSMPGPTWDRNRLSPSRHLDGTPQRLSPGSTVHPGPAISPGSGWRRSCEPDDYFGDRTAIDTAINTAVNSGVPRDEAASAFEGLAPASSATRPTSGDGRTTSPRRHSRPGVHSRPSMYSRPSKPGILTRMRSDLSTTGSIHRHASVSLRRPSNFVVHGEFIHFEYPEERELEEEELMGDEAHRDETVGAILEAEEEEEAVDAFENTVGHLGRCPTAAAVAGARRASHAVAVARRSSIAAGAIRPPPHHVFSAAKKRRLVYLVSLAATLSPLSSNSYFPALRDIADTFHVSIVDMALTITVFMIVQAVVPPFWAIMSDGRGRRITFMISLVVFLGSNVGLALSRGMPMLMVFRALQAAGSSAPIVIGSGVIGDLTTPRERGGLIGIFGGLWMIGTCIGPVIGGILDQCLGFRSIFWFLFIMGAAILVLIVLFLPETLRIIAGNGSVPLRGVNRPLIYGRPNTTDSSGVVSELTTQVRPPQPITMREILAPLRFLTEKDVFVTLTFGAVVYAVWSMMVASTAGLLRRRFGLTYMQIGLCFLPNGVGCVLGSYLTGLVLDRDYRVVEAQFLEQRAFAPPPRTARRRLSRSVTNSGATLTTITSESSVAWSSASTAAASHSDRHSVSPEDRRSSLWKPSQLAEQQAEQQQQQPPSPPTRAPTHRARRPSLAPSFPTEKARLRSVWWAVTLFVAATSGYGWSISTQTHFPMPGESPVPFPGNLALSLLLQFVIAYTATAVSSLNAALAVDLYPGAGASATAANNLLRFSLGAAGAGVVHVIIDSVGPGFCFLTFALVVAALSPLLVVEWMFGAGWRRKRTRRWEEEVGKAKEEAERVEREEKEEKVKEKVKEMGMGEGKGKGCGRGGRRERKEKEADGGGKDEEKEKGKEIRGKGSSDGRMEVDLEKGVKR